MVVKMDGDIEIAITSGYDFDGDTIDWEGCENWTKEQYRSLGFPEERCYYKVLSHDYKEIIYKNGLKKFIYCGKRLGSEIGLSRRYKNSILISQSCKKSFITFYEYGTYNEVNIYFKKKDYTYVYNDNDEKYNDKDIINFGASLGARNDFYTPFPNTDNSASDGMSWDSSSCGSSDSPAFCLTIPCSES